MNNWKKLAALLAASLLAGNFAACDDEGDAFDPDTGADTPGEVTGYPDTLNNERRCPEIADQEVLQLEEGFAVAENAASFQGAFGYEISYGRDAVVNPGEDQVLEGYVGRGQQYVTALAGTGVRDVAGETVTLFAEIEGAWTELGDVVTDAEGAYTFTVPEEFEFGVGLHRVLAVLNANGLCSEHAVAVYPEGTQGLVTDIDGTLTADDGEFITELGNLSHVPAANIAADTLMQTWDEKGYRVFYVTARPNIFRWQTRAWLREQGYPFGVVETATDFVFGDTAAEYKTAFLRDVLLDEGGFDIVAGYGNSDSDLQAYQNNSIPNAQIFSINEAEGNFGTTPISDGDYTSHVAGYVTDQPDSTNSF